MERCPHADDNAKVVFIGDRGFLLCEQCQSLAVKDHQAITPEYAIQRLLKKWGALTE